MVQPGARGLPHDHHSPARPRLRRPHPYRRRSPPRRRAPWAALMRQRAPVAVGPAPLAVPRPRVSVRAHFRRVGDRQAVEGWAHRRRHRRSNGGRGWEFVAGGRRRSVIQRPAPPAIRPARALNWSTCQAIGAQVWCQRVRLVRGVGHNQARSATTAGQKRRGGMGSCPTHRGTSADRRVSVMPTSSAARRSTGRDSRRPEGAPRILRRRSGFFPRRAKVNPAPER